MNQRNSYIIFSILILLLLLAGSIWWITYSIREKYLQNDPKLKELKDLLLPLHPDIKGIKLYKGNKSYTINKEKIYLCLRDENGKYYDNNMLIYVLIHELAHFFNREDIGHTEKFHEIFNKLLEKSITLGIYDPSIPPIQNYCEGYDVGNDNI